MPRTAHGDFVLSSTEREAGGQVVLGRKCSQLPIQPRSQPGPETPTAAGSVGVTGTRRV